MEINLIIGKNTTVYDIIQELSKYKTGILNINIEFSCNGFINSGIYLIITAFINEIKAHNIEFNLRLKNQESCDNLNYASRIDFFKAINIDYKENFKRKNTIKSLVPISKIEPNTYSLSEDIVSIFEYNFNMNRNDIDFITFIIAEMICNTTMHSKTKSGAYFFFQKYIDRLEFILVDNGIGINKSLSKNPLYNGLSNSETLRKSLDFEVTNGEGRGHGLYIMKEIVKEIGGNLEIISGNNSIFMNKFSFLEKENYNWNGVYLKINFKFGSNFSLESFYERLGR